MSIKQANLRTGALLLVLLSAFSSTDAVAADLDKSSGGWRLHGRFQLDGAQFDSNNPLFSDDTKIRRGRISLSGESFDGLKVKMEYELTGSTPGPKSMYIRQKFGKKLVVTAGHLKVPVSLQTATSSRYNTFMERALPNVGTTGYRLGIVAGSYGKFWSASGGFTGGGLDENYILDSDGSGFYGRFVLNPVRTKHDLLHFGWNTEMRYYGSSDSLRFRSRPESDLTDIRLVDTQRILDLDDSLRYTAEFAWKHDSVQFQAEYMKISMSRNIGLDLDFVGWYAQAGWFITGESRKYNRRNGSFRRTNPDHAYGAWEIAVRHSELGLNSAEILGGYETNDSLALNYYATKSIRLSLNYIEATARPNTTGLDEDVSIIQARFQFVF